MDWLRIVVAALLSAALSAVAVHFKNSRDTDIKLAVLESRITANKESHDDFKKYTSESIEEIASDMKAAARELLLAASNVQSMAQSQSIVNAVSTKLLDSLTLKVESQGAAIAKLEGQISTIKLIGSQNNHST